MIEIREATEQDNETLIRLQRRCPQGTSFVLGIDSSPNFFARSKPFKDWHVFVAVENGGIVGSAACAISKTCVEDNQLKTGYEYGFMVDPLHRRKGIARKLQEYVEHFCSEKNLDLLYLDIAEDNTPSLHLFSKHGFTKVKDCATFSLMAYRKHRITREENIRMMEKSDVDSVVNLINMTYHEYDFFTPFTTKDFIEYIGRIPYFDFQNIFVLEGNEGIEACLGYWDINKVRKYIVQRFNWRLKTQIYAMRLLGLFTKMPNIPRRGEPLLSYNLTTLAFKDSECALDLIKHTVNLAIENEIDFLHIPLDPDSQVATVLSQFRHTKVGLHFFIKSLKQKNLPDLGQRKVYVDIFEI